MNEAIVVALDEVQKFFRPLCCPRKLDLSPLTFIFLASLPRG